MENDMKIKLSKWAKRHDMSYRWAWQLAKEGKLDNIMRLPSGSILIEDGEKSERPDKTVIYCRVSSSQNKDNLESQAQRLTSFCIAKGWTISSISKEIGSGLNDDRKKLISLLSDQSVTRIVVEHKDRLTRFGFNYIKTLFKGEIVVVNEVEDDKKDLIEDFVSVITSFCARIYGLRRCHRKTEKIIEELRNSEKEIDK
jgi:predicted site-specific integrase-resolvase